MIITFARDPFPLGTGGAVRNALGKTNSKCLLILNGDSYFRLSLPTFLENHLKLKARASISLVQVKDSSRYGSVKINKDRKILAFLEKSPRIQSGLINAGIYLLERNVVKEIPEVKRISLEREIFPDLVGKGLYGVRCEGPFIDIGTPESFNKAEKILKREFAYL